MKDKLKAGAAIAGSLLLVGAAWAFNPGPDLAGYEVDEARNAKSAEVEEAPDSGYESRYGSDACTKDCSGHEAGYRWAKENDICDPHYDKGSSQSFNEGVIAWAYYDCYYGDGDESF